MANNWSWEYSLTNALWFITNVNAKWIFFFDFYYFISAHSRLCSLYVYSTLTSTFHYDVQAVTMDKWPDYAPPSSGEPPYAPPPGGKNW